MRSITVDGLPGSSPPSTSAPAPSLIASGTSSSRFGSRPPGRFALVAATTPTRSRTSAPGPSNEGTRTPIAPGFVPVNQRKRPAGFGEDQRDRPGQQQPRSLRYVPAKLGDALEQVVEVACDERARVGFGSALQFVEAPYRRLLIRVGSKPVDGVEREHDRLALAQSLDGVRHRRPSTTRSSSARSGVIVMSA